MVSIFEDIYYICNGKNLPIKMSPWITQEKVKRSQSSTVIIISPDTSKLN